MTVNIWKDSIEDIIETFNIQNEEDLNSFYDTATNIRQEMLQKVHTKYKPKMISHKRVIVIGLPKQEELKELCTHIIELNQGTITEAMWNGITQASLYDITNGDWLDKWETLTPTKNLIA